MVNKELYKGSSPYWSHLKEAMCGEVSNLMIRKYDYRLAEKYKPDILSFSQMDVMKCTSIEDLPDDWRKLAEACIEKYDIKP